MQWLLSRLASKYILVMMILTRFVGFLGGSLTIYYANLTLPNLQQHTHWELMGAIVTALAIVVTVLMAMCETQRLRRVLGQFQRNELVELPDAIEAGREAVQFCGRHHVHEAIVVPLVTTVPVCTGLWLIDGVSFEVIFHIVIATFLGISTSLLSTFFVIEKWMEPVIRSLLNRGVPIAYDQLPASSLRVRMNISFSIIIACTALMIGALANQRVLDIVRNPENQVQTVAELQRHITYIFVIAVLIGFVLTRVLAASVAARIATLVQAMKCVEAGSLSERLQPTGNDEVDGLTRQFNAMVDHLAQSDYVVRDLNANLERKVQRRTRELSKSRRTLKRSLSQLREYDRLKTQFFSNISHELRTPLTMILAPVERILHTQAALLPAHAVTMLETVRLNGRRLLELINRLLDFSKLEAGLMQVSKVPLDLKKVVEQLVTAARPLAEQRSIHLVTECDAEAGNIQADREKLDIIITNLVSNAIKFTPAGGSIRIQTRAAGERVRVLVTDTGIGLAPENLLRVFERFVQVDGSNSREFSGTGLGLSLVKELVELHGGQIGVESQLGHGSCFWFELPAAAPGEVAVEDSGPSAMQRSVRFADLESTDLDPVLNHVASAPAADGRHTVLVVDDTPDMRMLLGEILSDDYRVLFACDGIEGEQAAIREQPDLIISDVMMPHMDGYELCRRIKQNPATARIPLVLLTAKASLDMKIEGLDLGADDYLSKPFDEKELKARARSLIKLRKLNQDLDKQNRELEAAYRELAAVQGQLVQSEKMSSLGQLVAGLAHEINNSINAVYNGIKPLANNAHALEKTVLAQAGSQVQHAEVDKLFRKIFSLSKVIESGASRAMRIVADLRTFSHPGNEDFSDFDLHEALDMCVNLLSNQIRDRVVVDREYGPESTVFGPSGQLNQVFMNILNNAQQAINGKGTITITTKREDEWMLVSFRDTGGGIPDEIKNKIFDPFFTTKEPGVGTGLGLSLSYGIVSKLGGAIQCCSNMGEGTEFTVRFPITCKLDSNFEPQSASPLLSFAEGFPNETGCAVR